MTESAAGSIETSPRRHLSSFAFLALAVLIVALALPAAATAYRTSNGGGWEWQNPRPQGNPLAGIDFVDTLHGWAVGGKGAIVASSDGGSSWRTQLSGTTNDLNAVAFRDALRGWVVGDQGTILATSDGGQTWTPQAAGTSVDLRSLSFVDARRGWAVGSTSRYNADTDAFDYSGVILATTDGGATWVIQRDEETWGFSGVCFVDALHGWVVGIGSLVLVTADGGMTWESQSQHVASGLTSVAFTDTLHGCAVGRDVTYTSSSYAVTRVIIATSDGGISWRRVYSNEAESAEGSPAIDSVTFVDGEHGWAVGDLDIILVTTDGGATWQSQALAHAAGEMRSVDVLSVSAVDQQHVWVVANDNEHMFYGTGEVTNSWDGGIVLASADGGATWRRQGSGTFMSFRDVAFADRRRGWVVGCSSLTRSVAIFATTNGGVTWKPCLERDYMRPFAAVTCVDAKHCWAIHCSPGIGIIWRSADGGATWDYYARRGEWETGLGDLAFIDQARGWVVSGREIRSTRDGGKTWTVLRSPTARFLQGVAFTDARHGWAVGAAGTIIVTADGGATWRTQMSGTRADLSRVEFVDVRHGWAVGADGTIIATSDGGTNWKSQDSAATGFLSDVSFVDARRGWAVGGEGTVITTSDGGAHWTAQHSPAQNGLGGVDFVDAAHGWAAGGGGTILATSDGGRADSR